MVCHDTVVGLAEGIIRAPPIPLPIVITIPLPIAIGSIGLGIGALAWSIIAPIAPLNDYRAFYTCKQLHPEKYCAMRHLPEAR